MKHPPKVGQIVTLYLIGQGPVVQEHAAKVVKVHTGDDAGLLDLQVTPKTVQMTLTKVPERTSETPPYSNAWAVREDQVVTPAPAQD